MKLKQLIHDQFRKETISNNYEELERLASYALSKNSKVAENFT